MGQLEKYGLYVLCLVIFLILGVTIWGGGDLPPPSRRSAAQGTELNANPRQPVGNAATGNAQTGNPLPATGRGNDAGSDVVDLSSLLRPVQRPPAVRPVTEPKKADGKPVDANAAGNRGIGDAAATVGGNPPIETARPTYRVKIGDTFDSIAKEKLGSAALRTEIARLNPRVEPSRIQIGQELTLPSATELAARVKRDSATSPPAVADAAPDTYTVVKGDTFESIARRELGSAKRLEDLREANPGVEPKALRVGQKIRLPKK